MSMKSSWSLLRSVDCLAIRRVRLLFPPRRQSQQQTVELEPRHRRSLGGYLRRYRAIRRPTFPEDTGAEADTERSEAETEGEPPQRADVLIAAARSAQEHGAGLAPVVKKGSRNGGGHRVAWDDGGSSNWSNTAAIGAARKRKLLVARPFATMRGHTAFLTFATAGNKSWPDPNEEQK